MKLKVLSTQADGREVYTTGMIRDVDDSDGKKLIEIGLAEEAGEDDEAEQTKKDAANLNGKDEKKKDDNVKNEKNIIQVGKIGDQNDKNK